MDIIPEFLEEPCPPTVYTGGSASMPGGPPIEVISGGSASISGAATGYVIGGANARSW